MSGDRPSANEQIVRRIYDAFNARGFAEFFRQRNGNVEFRAYWDIGALLREIR